MLKSLNGTWVGAFSHDRTCRGVHTYQKPEPSTLSQGGPTHFEMEGTSKDPHRVRHTGGHSKHLKNRRAASKWHFVWNTLTSTYSAQSWYVWSTMFRISFQASCSQEPPRRALPRSPHAYLAPLLTDKCQSTVGRQGRVPQHCVWTSRTDRERGESVIATCLVMATGKDEWSLSVNVEHHAHKTAPCAPSEPVQAPQC